MSSASLLPLVIVAPLVGSAFALFGKLLRGASRAASVLAVLTLVPAAAVLAVLAVPTLDGKVLQYALGGWAEPYGIALVMDGLAWLSCALVVGLSFLIALASLSRRRFEAPYFFFFNLLVAGMLAVCLTGDLFTMFVGFEIVAIAAYVLIAYERTATGLIASFKYLMLSSVGILFFLFGVFLVYREVGTLSLRLMGASVDASTALRDATSMHLALAALCVGIGVRTAFIPFHTWLPEAHAYAPHPVSALLSGVLIKVSFFAMVRILAVFSGEYLSGLLMWLGAITAIVAVVSALSQTDAKRLLAFHSISQMGYILAVLGAGGALSLAAGFSHALNHALFKSLLFLTVGSAVSMTGERDLFAMSPVGRRSPLIAIGFFAGALSISGLPPWNGYASKALITEVMAGGFAYPLLWVTGFATIASFIKLSRVFLPPPSPGTNGVIARVDGPDRSGDPGPLFVVVTTVLTLLCLATGLLAGPLSAALHTLLSGTPVPKLPDLLAADKLLGTGLAVVLGVAIYAAAMTAPGKDLARRIRLAAPDLREVLLLFYAGVLAFALAAYF